MKGQISAYVYAYIITDWLRVGELKTNEGKASPFIILYIDADRWQDVDTV